MDEDVLAKGGAGKAGGEFQGLDLAQLDLAQRVSGPAEHLDEFVFVYDAPEVIGRGGKAVVVLPPSPTIASHALAAATAFLLDSSRAAATARLRDRRLRHRFDAEHLLGWAVASSPSPVL